MSNQYLFIYIYICWHKRFPRIWFLTIINQVRCSAVVFVERCHVSGSRDSLLIDKGFYILVDVVLELETHLESKSKLIPFVYVPNTTNGN